MMRFIRRLFFPPMTDRILFVYVTPKMCKEVLRVRIDTMNEPSRTDDEKGFYVRKIAKGNRCPFPVEIELWLDNQRFVTETKITNGEKSTQAEYEAFQATLTQKA